MTRRLLEQTTQPAKISGTNPARALSRVERMAGFAPESARIARATASIAMPAGHSWQLSAPVSFRAYDLPRGGISCEQPGPC